MPPSIETAQAWQGRTMVDPAGDKLGTIDAIYLDDETGQPEWATVTSGLFTAKTAFVPLAQAQDTGDSVQVPYDKQLVKDAPRVDPDGAGLSSRGDHTTFRYNVSTRHAGAGIRLGGDRKTQGVRSNVVGNTLADNAGYGLKVMRRPQGRIAGNTFARNRRGRTNQMA